MLHRNLKNKEFLNWLMFMMAYMLIIIGILNIIQALELNAYSEYDKHMDKLGPIGILFFIGVLIEAPLIEELIFRGFTMWIGNKITKKFTIINIIQAILFATTHINPIQIAYTFPMGLVFGKSKREFGTIWAPIILHSFSNFIGILPTTIIRLIYKLNNIPIEISENALTFEAKIILISASLLSIIIGTVIMIKVNKKINLISKDTFKFKKTREEITHYTD